jgi:hypothetical protein
MRISSWILWQLCSSSFLYSICRLRSCCRSSSSLERTSIAVFILSRRYSCLSISWLLNRNSSSLLSWRCTISFKPCSALRWSSFACFSSSSVSHAFCSSVCRSDLAICRSLYLSARSAFSTISWAY